MQNAIAWVTMSLLLAMLGLFMFFGHRTPPAPPAATRGGVPPGRLASDAFTTPYTHLDAESARYTLVMLLKAPRRLDRPTLMRAAENAFNVQFSQAPDNRLMLMPRPGLFAVITPSLRLGLIQANRPYYDDDELPAAVERERDPAVRRALEDHVAWLGVDWFGSLPEGGVDQAYNQICKLSAELLGEDVMAVGCTSKTSFHAYVPADRDVLRGPNPLRLFDAPASMPIGQTSKEAR